MEIAESIGLDQAFEKPREVSRFESHADLELREKAFHPACVIGLRDLSWLQAMDLLPSQGLDLADAKEELPRLPNERQEPSPDENPILSDANEEDLPAPNDRQWPLAAAFRNALGENAVLAWLKGVTDEPLLERPE